MSMDMVGVRELADNKLKQYDWLLLCFVAWPTQNVLP